MLKRITLLLSVLAFNLLLFAGSNMVPGKYSAAPYYMQLPANSGITIDKFAVWLFQNYKMPAGTGLQLLATESDKLGMVHYRYQQTLNSVPVEGTMYIVHTRNGLVESISGDLVGNITTGNVTVTPQQAIESALAYVNATEYKWQSAEAEKALKENTNNPNATYYPNPALVYVVKNNRLTDGAFELAYKMDVYAVKPFSRSYVYVNATTGAVLNSQNRIWHVNTTATALTQYSDTQTIITDSYTSGYRLRETGRGNGIRTYNAQNSTNPGNTDFSNATTFWNNVNANLDQYATDAHFASEETYDFYYNNFSRNSIDANGLALVAYVHYDTDLDNAFWDGGSMNYGDGSATNNTTPYTTLDIGGHEITHGLTQFTANLNYDSESGALNEAFSDIMGVCIRQYVNHKPVPEYRIGIDNGPVFRSMQNPKAYGQPDTYLGTYWYTGTQDNGGVHTNSGVANHWFYVLAQGEAGSTDFGAAYNVTGVGIESAQMIAYRTLTVYLTPGSQYADARYYSIKAAEDLFGVCSPQVRATTNAWYAVGVGPAFVQAVDANFGAPVVNACSVPANISFIDSSINAEYYRWDFGDGQTSFSQSPTHTYTTYGTFSVKLLAWSGSCGTDSITKTALITVNDYSPTTSGATTVCAGTSASLSASGSGDINWYDTPAAGSPVHIGATYNTPALTQNTTYYVENLIPGPAGVAGPADKNFGTGSVNNSDHYLEFNNTKPQNLISVLVNCTTAGNRTIELHDAADNVLQTKTVALTTGDQVVTLNFPIPVQNGLRLGIWNGTSALYRNSAGASYPYSSTDGSLTITGNDVGDPDRYYFFYNWHLQQDACVSERVPVTVTVGCTGINDVAEDGNIQLLPNPVANMLQVRFNNMQLNNGSNAVIRNILGETVIERKLTTANNGTMQIDVSELPAGAYMFTLLNGNSRITKRFVKN
jgi:Zn-dependent metalloprotease